MSDSSQGDDFESFHHNSDGECSATSISASSLASHPQGRPKCPRATQTLGKAWFLRGEIETHLLPNDSDDPKFQRIQSHLQNALVAKFEVLFVKMCNKVKYFQIFCNFGDILHDVPAAAQQQQS
jgi:hypothetical protein